jgi:hypothetical protein
MSVVSFVFGGVGNKGPWLVPHGNTWRHLATMRGCRIKALPTPATSKTSFLIFPIAEFHFFNPLLPERPNTAVFARTHLCLKGEQSYAHFLLLPHFMMTITLTKP